MLTSWGRLTMCTRTSVRTMQTYVCYWTLIFTSSQSHREATAPPFTCLRAQSLSGVRLCDPVDCSLPVFSVHGIFQAGMLEVGAISFSRGSSQPRDQTRVSCVSCIACRFFTAEPLGKPFHLAIPMPFTNFEIEAKSLKDIQDP